VTNVRESLLYQKVLGCLVGGAIGDAFGIRVEMMHYRDIEAQYGRVTHFDSLPPRRSSQEPPLERWYPFGMQPANEGGFHPLGRWSREVGMYTDDMRYRLMACQAIVRKRGPITGADLAEEWLNYRLMAEGAVDYRPTLSWPGPQRAYARIMASVERLTAMAQQQRPCFSGWDAPIGLIHAGDPESAAAAGYSMAVAIAAALAPGATIDDVIASVLGYAGSLGSQAHEFVGRLKRLLDVAAHCEDVFALREPFYREFLVTFPPWEAVFALEMVPCALALCLIAHGDAAQAIVGATNMGRDSDTIAAMAGELMGALGGAQAFPAPWVEQVLRLNPQPDLPGMAEELCEVIVQRARQHQHRVTDLLSLI
jgi:ADP-ribosylglycohydrolase